MASESRSETDPLGPKGLEPEEREPRIGAPDPEEIGGALLEELLLEDPCSFEFFQAVRLLRRLRPSLEGVGQFAHPSREVVRFSSNPRLGFPAGQVQELEQDPRQTLRMEVNFMGLVGNQGVLPLHYSRMVRRQEKENQDHPLRDFLDIFQHRIVSLFYRAWERARFFVPFERGEGDAVSARVYDRLGLGGP